MRKENGDLDRAQHLLSRLTQSVLRGAQTHLKVQRQLGPIRNPYEKSLMDSVQMCDYSFVLTL